MSRQRHKHKEIEAAIQYAESLGWTVDVGGSHAWGFLQCPIHRRGSCNLAVWSTPKNPGSFARKLLRDIKACDCAETREGDDDE
jgi:hypothetical protein